jgi:Flp pilus assembly protein protease CpaA
VVFFFCGWCGGGDAKLLAAIALWHDYDNLFQYLLYTAVAGGMLATALSMLRSVRCPGCCWRLESMIMVGGYALPVKTIREMITGSIDIIVQVSRHHR